MAKAHTLVSASPTDAPSRLAHKKAAHLPEPLSRSTDTQVLLPYRFAALPRSFRQPFLHDGDEGTRTPDLLRAREALSQLSYIPASPLSAPLMGHNGLEPLTFPLSEECSSQLS